MRLALPLALAGVLACSLALADENAAPSPSAVAGAPAQSAPAKKPRKRKKKRDLKGPIANFPGFRLLSSGASRVWVEISQKVDISEHNAPGRLVYRMKGVTVPTRTNRLPLETMFFPTPVSRVMLVELDDGDLDLVIELRQPATPTQKLVETEGGFMLVVDFPPPQASATNAPSTGPSR